MKSREATEEEVLKAGLKHRVYLPEGWEGRARPVVVLIHGRAGTSQAMWTFSKAFEAIKPVIVAPEASIPDPAGGFSWWSVFEDEANQIRKKRTLGKDLLPAFLKLRQFLKSLPSLYNTSPNKVVGIGFSQGGGLLSAYTLAYPKTFIGAGLLASFLPSITLEDKNILSEELQQNASRRMPPFFIAHGSEDKIVPLERAEWSKLALEGLGAEVTFHVDSVGHKVGAGGVKALGAWFEKILEENSG